MTLEKALFNKVLGKIVIPFQTKNLQTEIVVKIKIQCREEGHKK